MINGKKIVDKMLKGTFLILFLFLASNLMAQTQKPLLMEGKQTLFQRVLSVPDAKLYKNASFQSNSENILPFSVYYVYQRKIVGETEWLNVGTNSFGKLTGWVPEQSAITWNQALTVSFKDPQDIQRVLLFQHKKTIQKLVDEYQVDEYLELHKNAIAGKVNKSSPIVAIQPEAHVDIRNNFYLVPIKQHEDVYLGNEQARLLEVASVPLEEVRNNDAKQKQNTYKSGIHFVIDSTSSMGEYIDRTREAVRKVYSAISNQNLEKQVSFGLTAFRDNTDQVPELEYLTRDVVNLEEGFQSEAFFSRVDTVKPATVSSQDFREDAYAGIKSAIEDTNWKNFDARYIVLITDAGPRESHDALSSTRLSAEALRQLAYDRGISIWVLHLRTPAEKADHQHAESRYKELSFYPGIGDFYYGVKLGEVDEFGSVLETLANQITQQVLATVNGVPPIPLPSTDNEDTTELTQLQNKVAQLGNALRLRYLINEEGKPLPKFFNAWMIDRDFKNPEKSSVDVRILLTRDQLSDLKSVMQQVLELAEEGVLSPKNFIDDLQSLAATVSRDPSAVGSSTSGSGTNLAEMGYMREYIEDLPYTGEVMNLTLDNWEGWSAKEQIEFMNRLDSKINYYQALHDHTDLWVTPGGGAVNGNSVFPVVLDLLP